METWHALTVQGLITCTLTLAGVALCALVPWHMFGPDAWRWRGALGSVTSRCCGWMGP